MGTIVEFPKKEIKRAAAKSKADLADELVRYKEEVAEEVSEFLWRHVLGELERVGCDLSTDVDGNFPSMILVLESIRSLHLLANGIHHPLQDFANDSIDVELFKKKGVDIDEDID